MKFEKALDIEPELFSALKKSHQSGVGQHEGPIRGKTKLQTPIENWDLVDKPSFNALNQWFYLPILELTTLSDFDGSI